MKVALITGASDGIGLATARLLDKRGYRVYGLSRTPVSYPFMIHRAADVTDGPSLRRAVTDIVRREGRIDLLVCCAGASLASPAELTKMADAHHVFDVNYWGCVRTVSLVLPLMKRARRGNIVLVSSVTGLFPIPYLSYYSSSKAALISYGCSLWSECRPLGVKVSVVAPGGVRTGFTHKRKKYWHLVGDERAPGLGGAIAAISLEEQTGLYPAEVAAVIADTAARRHPPALMIAGDSYKALYAASRVMPRAMTLRALYHKYGGFKPWSVWCGRQIDKIGVIKT